MTEETPLLNLKQLYDLVGTGQNIKEYHGSNASRLGQPCIEQTLSDASLALFVGDPGTQLSESLLAHTGIDISPEDISIFWNQDGKPTLRIFNPSQLGGVAEKYILPYTQLRGLFDTLLGTEMQGGKPCLAYHVKTIPDLIKGLEADQIADSFNYYVDTGYNEKRSAKPVIKAENITILTRKDGSTDLFMLNPPDLKSAFSAIESNWRSVAMSQSGLGHPIATFSESRRPGGTPLPLAVTAKATPFTPDGGATLVVQSPASTDNATVIIEPPQDNPTTRPMAPFTGERQPPQPTLVGPTTELVAIPPSQENIPTEKGATPPTAGAGTRVLMAMGHMGLLTPPGAKVEVVTTDPNATRVVPKVKGPDSPG